MNSTIAYSERAAAIRGILAMQSRWPEHSEYVEDATLEMLQRIETGLAESLARGGMAKEVAAQSAFEFVRGCVEAFRAGSSAVR